jgi:hypothetical protein
MPDRVRATRILLASDEPFDLLAWTNNSVAQLLGKSRAKRDFRSIADAHEDSDRVTELWGFLAHSLLTDRRARASTTESQRACDEQLEILAREFPLSTDAQSAVGVKERPDAQLDEPAVRIAFGSFAVLFGGSAHAESLALFDSSDPTAQIQSRLVLAQWLGSARSIHRERTIGVTS